MATKPENRTIAPIVGPDDPRRFTDSGIEVEPLYDQQDLPDPRDVGDPGSHPYARGIRRDVHRTQNDVLKEYIARGNYIYPPEATMRLTTNVFEYCKEHVPSWNTISISGYHFREKGCSAVQEVAFTLSNGIAYVQAALDAGLEVDDFAPRLAFFFNGHNNVFQEVAKFRAARRMWASLMKERFGAENTKSMMLRFHTQTGGVTLTAQQPENNVARVALQGFAAVCGGTQSLHTNGFDEALALPTERSARIELRTQQIIDHESGAAF